MKCHKCGAYIPEGHMYCDKCGAEINIVPDFEPEVENEIDNTLSSIAGKLAKDDSYDSHKRTDRHTHVTKASIGRHAGSGKTRKSNKDFNDFNIISYMKDNKKIVIGSAIAIAILFLIVFSVSLFQDKTGNKYIKLAQEARNKGNNYEAVAYLSEGKKKNPNNINIIFELSDCYLELGDTYNAVETLKTVVDSDLYSKDYVTAAYERIISIYKQLGEYAKIAEILNEGQSESAYALKKEYIPEKPIMVTEPNTYEERVEIEISCNEGDVIYYTVNGDIPTKKSTVYRKEIDLEVDGEYNIKAVAINEYGVPSDVVESIYIVEKGAAPNPEIIEESGDYTQNTMIVAVAGEGCTIYYTTDGSDPTMESEEYVDSIPMPLGKSHYKFIAYNEKGNPSEIVEREFHLVYPRTVSRDQAKSSLINKLLKLDVLLDDKGSVRGGGHNEYNFKNVIEVKGAGEYYMFVEEFVRGDGTRTGTGRFFAVNTHDGSLNHLGYDNSGNYTLKLIK